MSFSRKFVISDGFKLVLLNVPVMLLFAEHTYQFTTVRGSSMAPAINEFTGQTTRVLIDKTPLLAKDDPKTLQINDVVYLRSPLDPERFLIKRVKGLPGDTIKPLHGKQNMIKVPRNHFWLEGDNNFHSIDSNDFGPVSLGLIEAKVMKKVDFTKWPFFTSLKGDGGREARVSMLDKL